METFFMEVRKIRGNASARWAGSTAGASRQSDAWLFAQALLGNHVPTISSAEADARAKRQRLEWLAEISTEHESKMRSLLREEADERERQERLERLAEFSNLHEAQWDPDKHPRGGFSQNRGWWSPTGGTPQFLTVSDKSPTGHVVLQLTPEKPDSMDWSKAKFKEPDKVSNTHTNVGGDWKVEKESRGGKDVYRVKYTLKGTAVIELDPERIKVLARRKRGLSLETAYGHEQRHVENFITIMKRGEDKLKGLEEAEYDSNQAASKAGEKNLNAVAKEIKKALADDARHQGKNPKSPTEGEPYKSIGVMPAMPR
jgi:hypothetical protein